MDGLQPRVILVVDVSHGADVVVGRAGMKTMQDLKGKSVAVESGALGAFVLSRALALNGMQASDVNVVHLESNEQPKAFEKGTVDGAVTFDPVSRQFLQAGAATLFDSTQIPGEIVDLVAVRASVIDEAAEGGSGAACRLVQGDGLHEGRSRGRGATHGNTPTDERRAVPGGPEGSPRSDARGKSQDARRADAGIGGYPDAGSWP